MLPGGWFGNFGGGFDSSWIGLIYFSGIDDVTLGYTRIEVDGPLRMISMMQSLGGFMAPTWSATFIYSIQARAVEHR